MQNVPAKRFLIPVVAAAMLSATLVGVGVAQRDSVDNGVSDQAAVEAAQSLSHAFRRAANTIMPAVVKIRTVTRARQVGNLQNENPFEGSPLERFFDDDELKRFFNNPRMPRQRGLGTGVIIDAEGIILTNDHVVSGADEVIVELADGREFKTTKITTDPDTDLAVVRIAGAGKLPVARLGNSANLSIGDWVIAVGHPFDLNSTVSAGIISGKGRSLSAGRRSSYIQTDAAINPGNSGGPLVNLDGEVVGINTAIASNSGGYQGVGFAIPVDLAKWVSEQLINNGSVERAFLGVKIGETTAELAEQFGVQPNQGVLVGDVLADSPAGEAGLETGDLILKFAGERVRHPRELQRIVERSKIGVAHPVEILRAGKKKTLDVVLKAMPKTESLASAEGSEDSDPTSGEGFEANAIGIEVANVSAGAAEQLGFAGYEGVLITEVDPQGPAAENGLREGMLIRQVGRQKISNIEEFEKALNAQSVEDGVLLLVRTSSGGQFFVVVKS